MICSNTEHSYYYQFPALERNTVPGHEPPEHLAVTVLRVPVLTPCNTFTNISGINISTYFVAPCSSSVSAQDQTLEGSKYKNYVLTFLNLQLIDKMLFWLILNPRLPRRRANLGFQILLSDPDNYNLSYINLFKRLLTHLKRTSPGQ